MDINKHPINRAIYELGLQIENLPASEQQTKISVMCSDLQKPADQLLKERDEREQDRIKSAARCYDLMEKLSLIARICRSTKHLNQIGDILRVCEEET